MFKASVKGAFYFLKQLFNLWSLFMENNIENKFGESVKEILKSMMGKSEKPVTIKGNKQQVEAFKNTIVAEKKFLDSYKDRGTDHPKTQKEKLILEREIENFERVMGVDWPFKE